MVKGLRHECVSWAPPPSSPSATLSFAPMCHRVKVWAWWLFWAHLSPNDGIIHHLGLFVFLVVVWFMVMIMSIKYLIYVSKKKKRMSKKLIKILPKDLFMLLWHGGLVLELTCVAAIHCCSLHIASNKSFIQQKKKKQKQKNKQLQPKRDHWQCFLGGFCVYLPSLCHPPSPRLTIRGLIICPILCLLSIARHPPPVDLTHWSATVHCHFGPQYIPNTLGLIVSHLQAHHLSNHPMIPLASLAYLSHCLLVISAWKSSPVWFFDPSRHRPRP